MSTGQRISFPRFGWQSPHLRSSLRPVVWLSAGALFVAAFWLGRHASLTYLAGLVVIVLVLLLLARPYFALALLTVAALVLPISIPTGTEVVLNPATLLVPGTALVWLLYWLTHRELGFATSATNRPLFLFVIAALLSLLVGRATWDVAVPVKSNFVLVQLAQWAIFAFSATVYWLAGNMIRSERNLKRLTHVFLLGGEERGEQREGRLAI